MDANYRDLTPLLRRASTGRLIAPAPVGAELKTILSTALRAPDHGQLRPARFIVIPPKSKNAFIDIWLNTQHRYRGDFTAEKLQKRRHYYRAVPLYICLGMKFVAQSSIPRHEQEMSVAASAMNILNALEIRGYSGMWVSGDYCHDMHFLKALSTPPLDALAGILLVGTPHPERKLPTRPDIGPYVTLWDDEESSASTSS